VIETSGPVAIYTRISEDRDGERLGVERQLDDCKKLAKRLGWTVGEIYSDNNLSASKSGVVRPAYQRLLVDVSAGRVSRIITDKPDRLYRKNTELEHLIDVVGNGVEIRTVKAGDIDLSTTNGRMIARILGATAQAEAETIKDRVKRKMASLIESGAWKGGPRPFGWQGDGVTEIPAEIELLRAAVKTILAGGNVFAICADWRRRGIVSGRGKVIEATTLRGMLISPRLIGRYAASKGAWKAVISEADSLAVAAILTARKARRPYRKMRGYLLTGVIRCAICGGPLYGTPTFGGRKVGYYRCSTSAADHGGKGGVNIQVAQTDTAVSATVLTYLGSKAFKARQAKVQRESPGLTAAVMAMAKVDAERDKLATAYGDGKLEMDEWLTAKSHLTPRIEAATSALELAQSQSAELADLATGAGWKMGDEAAWSEIDPEGKRRIILALVNTVSVRPHAGSNHSYKAPDPDRGTVNFK